MIQTFHVRLHYRRNGKPSKRVVWYPDIVAPDREGAVRSAKERLISRSRAMKIDFLSVDVRPREPVGRAW